MSEGGGYEREQFAQSIEGLDVLIVEDDKSNRDYLENMLISLCRLQTANSGEAAIELVRQSRFAIAIIDINLGSGIDGIETMKTLKRQAVGSDLKVVALTAYAMREDEERILNHGFDSYMRQQHCLNV